MAGWGRGEYDGRWMSVWGGGREYCTFKSRDFTCVE